MSHELPAAGYGFIWPNLAFISDGESIHVKCRPSLVLSAEPAHYLAEFDAFVPAPEFEREIDNFVELVLRRLDSSGQTELHVLWGELLAERSDPEQTAARKMEARLGFDVDGAPSGLLDSLRDLASEAGADAADEIAPVCAGKDPMGTLNEVIRLASGNGVQAAFTIPVPSSVANGRVPPWQRARQLALGARKSLGLGGGPLDDETLSELLRIPSAQLGLPDFSSHARIGLAVRSGANGHCKLIFRKKNRPARRFEAARFIADFLSSEGRDRWLPVTDAATARQKLQRAFAAEFLCPIESLRTYLGSEFLPEAFEDAAEYFGISEMAVKSHLANHHLIPPSLIESDTIA
jgi:hypothetical protein